MTLHATKADKGYASPCGAGALAGPPATPQHRSRESENQNVQNEPIFSRGIQRSETTSALMERTHFQTH
jgi:hypothetical protein